METKIAILSEKATVSLIGSISRRGVKFDHDVWQCSASALHHAADCGDFTLFSRVLNAMPKGSRVATLISWAGAFSPVSVTKDKTGIYKVSKDKGLEAQDWDLDSLLTIPWWEHKTTPAATIIDLEALSEYLRKIEEGKDTATKKIAQEARDGAAYLRAALAAMAAKTVTVAKAPLVKVA